MLGCVRGCVRAGGFKEVLRVVSIEREDVRVRVRVRMRVLSSHYLASPCHSVI